MVDPSRYAVEFENASVRVLRVHFEPHAKGALHEHLLNRVVVYMNDQPYSMEQVSTVVAPLYAGSDRALVISIRGDREVPYRFMDQLQKELVAAGVVRVVFAAELEQSMQRERR